MKRLIAVSWAMPPMLFPRAIQVSRLIAHLNELGWNCTVVSLQPSTEIEGGINDVELAAQYAGSYQLVRVDSTPPAKEPDSPLAIEIPLERFANRPFWQRHLTQHEDPQTNAWIMRATDAVRAEMRHNRASVLVTFAQPWSDHLIGLRLRARYWWLPWIAHFSDPWVDSPYADYASDEARAIERAREASVVRWADRLVFVTERTAELVMRKYPARYRAKVRVVPHGFDDQILTAAVPDFKRNAANSGPRLRLVFTGQLLQAKRVPDSLLRALSEMREAGELDESSIEIVFVGLVPPDTESLIATLRLAAFVRIVPRVEYVQSLREAANADVLLVIDAPAEDSVFLPSKFVDYLMMRKPILAFSPRSGAVADIMRELDYPMVEPADVAGARAALRDIIRKWRDQELALSARHDEVAARYDIKNVAAKFSNVADTLIARRFRPGTLIRRLAGRPRPSDTE